MALKILEFVLDHLTLTAFLLMAIFVVAKILSTDKHQKRAQKILQKAIKMDMAEPLTLHPEIDPAKCMGCGACTTVCPEGDILKLIHHKAVLVSPTKCVGHGECEVACPADAIKLVFGTKKRGMDIPRLSANYETNVPGVYIAGELGGMGLIRNAIKQGVLAAQHAVKNSGSLEKDEYDLLIVGAGPAGLAAALVAIANKKKYLLMDQNTLGGAVFHFPRQKIVMSHPFEMPIVGRKEFPSHKVSKEELLAYWEKVRRATGMKITEGCRFEDLENRDSSFFIKTNLGEFRSKKVILATGVRGSPRKLGVPGEEQSKVTYNLIDPEQYQGKAVVVVGGGNAGVEAAQMLGDPKWKNQVKLLVRGNDFDRCNEENRIKVTEMHKKGYLEICFSSVVQEIEAKQIIIKRKDESETLPNDFVFIFAGAEMPHKFLMSLGVKIDKKFGEGLKPAS